jgi:hypothetical protein
METGIMAAIGKAWAFLINTFPLVFGVALSHHIDPKSAIMTISAKAASYFFGIGLAFLFTRYLVEVGKLQVLTYELALVQVTSAAICVRVFAKRLDKLIDLFSK